MHSTEFHSGCYSVPVDEDSEHTMDELRIHTDNIYLPAAALQLSLHKVLQQQNISVLYFMMKESCSCLETLKVCRIRRLY